MADIDIQINHSLSDNDFPIAFVQEIEKNIDAALQQLDFERIATMKGNVIVLKYKYMPRHCDMTTVPR